jgi:uncharacterized protein
MRAMKLVGLVTHDRVGRYAPFVWWVAWFFSAWLVVVMAFRLERVVAEHWPVALAMLLGSYIAGSTPMGGGTIGFPVLVLLFDGPASLGRGFSYCIQSVGMVSATLFILCSRRPCMLGVLVWAFAGATVSLPLSLALVAPLFSDTLVKLAFGCIWGGFGLLTLVKLREVLSFDRVPVLPVRTEATTGLAVGFLGGLAAGLTGVGADMILYTVLVLLFRADIRVAIASSIVLMAYCSMVGAMASASMGLLDREVLHNWLAAAPIVLVGAPIGALVVRYIPRGPTLVVVAVLCVFQLVYIVWANRGERFIVPLALLAVLAMNGAFHALHVAGRRLERRRGSQVAEALAEGRGAL